MDAVSLLSSRLPRPHIALLCFSMTAKACIDIDATKKVNRSLTEKRFVHFRLSKASQRLAPSRQGVTEDRTTTCFTDPYMGLEAALFGRLTVDKSCKW